MGRPLDLTLFELKTFVRASRGRSLRETARELGLKPAHMSKVIARIESKVGVRLFRRSATGIQLTPEAMVLLRAAEEITERAEALPDRGGVARSGQAQPAALGLGAVSFMHSCLIVPALAGLGREVRRTRFRLVETPREDLIAQGLSGAFEIAVHLGELEWPRTWVSRRVGGLRYGLYARAGHPLGSEATEEQVLRFPFVMPTYWVRQRLSLGYDQCPLPMSQRLWGHETTTATAALQLVIATDQLAFLPRIVAQDAVVRGLASEVRVRSWPVVEHEVFVSVRADAVSQRVFQGVVRALKATQARA